MRCNFKYSSNSSSSSSSSSSKDNSSSSSKRKNISVKIIEIMSAGQTSDCLSRYFRRVRKRKRRRGKIKERRG